MIDLEIIWEEAIKEVTKFAKDSEFLTGWEEMQEDPRLLSSGGDEQDEFYLQI